MKINAKQFLTDTALMMTGSFLQALAINGFLRPHEFISGGLAGTSLIIYYNWADIPIPFSILFMLLNVPLFALGYAVVGRKFILFSLWAVFIYTLMFQFVTPRIQISDQLLSAIAAGMLSGAGVALILRTNGTSSGTEILAIIINKHFSINLSVTNMAMNGLVLLCACLFFPFEKVLYSFVFIVMHALVMNGVFKSLARRKAVMIMSRKWKDILFALNESNMRIGVTLISAKGGYTGSDDPLLYSVVRSSHVGVLRRIATRIDPTVFIAVMETTDIINDTVGNQPPWKKALYK